MRLAVLLAIAACAPGCQLIFDVDPVFDPVPHVPTELETPGKKSIHIMANGSPVAIDTTPDAIMPDTFDGIPFTVVRQTGGITDVVVMQVKELRVDGVLNVIGTRPLVVVAETVLITGTVDAGATGTVPGPGGARPNAGLLGEGGAGLRTNDFMNRNHSGGGGGAFGPGAAPGGEVDCADRSLPAGGGSVPFGTDQLVILEGGGAGGAGGFDCTASPSNGGGGGGALQLSASVSITIEGTVSVGGGGGQAGHSGGLCTAGDDGAGSGGGAGGAIYLDAPTISNAGTIAAHGGGGGGGANITSNGVDGRDARDPMASLGGFGSGKGTPGGDGATVGNATAGITGICDPLPAFNTGGGGGGHGRIVLRGIADPIGTVTPPATELPR